MIIEKLDIKGFGKITNLELCLKEGMNLIYGENEAGKSTLQWFIKAMFYGLRGGRQTKEEPVPPLRRFKPWKGESYGGIMEYRLDNGQRYRVERDFSRNSVRIYDSLFGDISDMFEISRESGLKFAEQHLGINQACFERTAFIRQMTSAIDEDGNRELLNRFINIGQTGFEDISFRNAEAALKDALKNYVGTERTYVRPLDRVIERLQELKRLKEDMEQKRKMLLYAGMELRDSMCLKNRLEDRKRALAQIKDLVDIRKIMEDLREKESVLKGLLAQICKDEAALKRMQEGREKRAVKTKAAAVLLFCAIVVFAMLALLNKPLFNKPVSLLVPVLILPVCTAAAAIALMFRRHIKHEEKMRKKMELAESRKDKLGRASLAYGKHIGTAEQLSEAIKNIETEWTVLHTGFKKKAALFTDESIGIDLAQKYKLKQAMPAAELKELESMAETELNEIEARLDETALKIRECETILKSQAGEDEAEQRIEEEIYELEARKKLLEGIGFSLKTALDVLSEASMELQRDFVPALNVKLAKIISGLSGGKYSDMRADDKLSLKVIAPETGEVTEARVLSAGAVEQVYLALRLSAIEIFEAGNEKLPLIADEIFAHYDDRRVKQAFAMFCHSQQDRQVIFFTCKAREAEIAREVYQDRLNMIYLGGC